jgi:hypothetical protein
VLLVFLLVLFVFIRISGRHRAVHDHEGTPVDGRGERFLENVLLHVVYSSDLDSQGILPLLLRFPCEVKPLVCGAVRLVLDRTLQLPVLCLTPQQQQGTKERLMSSRYTVYTRLKIDHPTDRILQVVSLYGALIAQFSDVSLPIAPIRSETDNPRSGHENHCAAGVSARHCPLRCNLLLTPDLTCKIVNWCLSAHHIA